METNHEFLCPFFSRVIWSISHKSRHEHLLDTASCLPWYQVLDYQRGRPLDASDKEIMALLFDHWWKEMLDEGVVKTHL